jgi:hypothetical protein
MRKQHIFLLALALLTIAAAMTKSYGIVSISVGLCGLLLIAKYCNRYIRNKLEHFLSIYPTRNNNYVYLERNYDAACLGGTEAVYAVQAENNLGVKLLNWASENQTLSYSYLIIQNAFSLLKETGLVLLFVTPRSFRGMEQDDKNSIRYDFFLDRYLLYFHDNKKFRLRDWLFVNILNYRGRDSVFLRAFAYYPILYPLQSMRLLMELFERERMLKETRNHFQPYRAGPGNDMMIEKNKKTLLEICRFLAIRNLRPVIVIPPVSKQVQACYPVDFVKKIQAWFESDIPIPILNYLDKKEFECEDIYLDSYRLNVNGRNLFTECLLRDCNNSCYAGRKNGKNLSSNER